LGHNRAPRSADGSAPWFPRPTFSNGCSVECDRGGNSIHGRRRPRSPRGATVNTAGVGISNRVEGASGAAAPGGCPQSTAPPSAATEAGSLDCSEGPQDAGLGGRFFVARSNGRRSLVAPTLADFACAPLASATHYSLRWPVPPIHRLCPSTPPIAHGPAQLPVRPVTGIEKSC
jgi:hypothetical protein